MSVGFHHAACEVVSANCASAAFMLSSTDVDINPVLNGTVFLLQGDVIGCFLHMPDGGRAFEKEKSVSHPPPASCHMAGALPTVEHMCKR